MKKTNSISRVLLYALVVAAVAATLFETLCYYFGIINVLGVMICSIPVLLLWIFATTK
jgi:hypothetical protein